jgi:hypothetical protein
MGSTAKLHASGKNFLGYPCEWRLHALSAVIRALSRLHASCQHQRQHACKQ